MLSAGVQKHHTAKDEEICGMAFSGAVFLLAISSSWIGEGKSKFFAGMGCQITYENYQRIRAGMTRTEVEALLGCRPGDYSGGPLVTVSGGNCWWEDSDSRWIGNDGIIIIRFKDNNTVANHIFSQDPMKAFVPACSFWNKQGRN
jgi:hypothetical protein